jgi:hypothetical protein
MATRRQADKKQLDEEQLAEIVAAVIDQLGQREQDQRAATEPQVFANDLVGALGVDGPEVLAGQAAEIAAHATAQAAQAAQAGEPAPAPPFAGPESPDRVSFVGYLGDRFFHRGLWWLVLYLDWDMQTFLVIESTGFIRADTLPTSAGSGTPEPRNVIWVRADTAVGRVARSLSLEGMFLTGDFTRAGDFEAGPADGGTFAAATGVFCGARSPGCCIVTKKKP